MSILIDRNTKIAIHGMTGHQGRLHGARMIADGANVVCGISPGKGGSRVLDRPIYNSVSEAVEHEHIDASLILVPPLAVRDSAVEAIENGIKVISVIADGVPIHDTMYIRSLAKKYGAVVSGPNTTGIISPGKSKLGIMPAMLYLEGNIGIISRSGSLTHETASALTVNGIGQSTCFGIGGDPVPASTYTQILELFRKDKDTSAVVMICEIGGTNEDDAADYILSTHYPKPIFAFIAGKTAPPEKSMGHAGAIVSNNSGSASVKKQKLEKGGVTVVETFEELVEAIKMKV